MTIRRGILGLLVMLGANAARAADLPPLSADWIWLTDSEKAAQPYNQTIEAAPGQAFDVAGRPRSAVMRITADSYYRLFINGRWVNDGPGRAWPLHYEYDVIDVASYLRERGNVIRIVSRYNGVGDFHRVPQAPGLLAQLDIEGADGQWTSIKTGASWKVADLTGLYQRNTPKVSIQMEPFELLHAGRAPEGGAAAVVAATNAGPWKGLIPRDTALLTRQPFALKAFLGANVMARPSPHTYCLPAARLVHPGLIEANNHTSMACGMATIVVNAKPIDLLIDHDGFDIRVDGQPAKEKRFHLEPGRHALLALVADLYGHGKEKSLSLREPVFDTLENPLDAKQANPWCFIAFPEYAVAGSDTPWTGYTNDDPKLAGARDGYNRTKGELLVGVKNEADFAALVKPRARVMDAEAMFVTDPFWDFTHRQVKSDATALVDAPAALMHESPAVTTIRPCPDGDIELLYDLGEQNVGYYSVELEADAGVIVDLFGVEYIAPDGRVQYSWGNRNGMRYATESGVNRFTSLKRRSQRYLFVTLRNQTSPVRIRNIHLVESTYPVNQVGTFRTSDERLNRIWDISTRTLKLCMEDTFTDCPLYEQTHWVGDARNESLFAYGTFDARDLALRCVRLTAESLERLPIAGCQTPSCWDVLIPNWSFLWGQSVWDYYWYTGDTAAAKRYWPAVLRNLEGAEKLVNDRDLISGPFWNFFDWTPIDSNQRTVLHNSLMCVGAIDAALKIGDAIGDHSKDEWLKAFRGRLAKGVNQLWDETKQAYPDSIRDDGSISPSTSQHTSFLGVLYDVVPPERREAAQRNVLNPPEGMVKVGSPFAALYLYHALEKMGQYDAIMSLIYKNYLPMLDEGATTVWESFASGTTGGNGFPTQGQRAFCVDWVICKGLRPACRAGIPSSVS